MVYHGGVYSKAGRMHRFQGPTPGSSGSADVGAEHTAEKLILERMQGEAAVGKSLRIWSFSNLVLEHKNAW